MENKKIHVSNAVMDLLVNYFFNNDEMCILSLNRGLFAFELTQEEYFNLVAAVATNRIFLEVHADNATNPFVFNVDAVVNLSNNRYFIDVHCLSPKTLGHTLDLSSCEGKHMFTNVTVEMTDDDSSAVYRHLDEWRNRIENQNDKRLRLTACSGN